MAARLRHQGIGKTLELGFAGDVSLGGIIDQLLPNSVPDASKRKAARQAKQQYPVLQRGMRTSEVWGDCVGDLQAGVMALSLVSPLTMHGQRAHRGESGHVRPLAQRAHPLQVEALVDANVDVVALANGHSMSFQEDGLVDTWAALDAARLKHTGTGEDRDAALRPSVLRATGRRLAYFSISAEGCGLQDAAGNDMWEAADRRTGLWHFELWDPRMHSAALLELRNAIADLRQRQRITFVIVSVCWGTAGPDGRPWQRGDVPPQIQSFARGLVDVARADVVHGHGTGFMMGVEVHKGRPIIYSCGVLLSDALANTAPAVHEARQQKRERTAAAAAAAMGAAPPAKRLACPQQRPDISFAARLVVDGTNSLAWLELRPLHCRMLQVNRARGAHRAWALEVLTSLCADLGTPAQVSRAGLRIAISRDPPEEPAALRKPNPELHVSGRQQQGDSGGSNAQAAGRAASAWWTPLGGDQHSPQDSPQDEDGDAADGRSRRSRRA